MSDQPPPPPSGSDDAGGSPWTTPGTGAGTPGGTPPPPTWPSAGGTPPPPGSPPGAPSTASGAPPPPPGGWDRPEQRVGLVPLRPMGVGDVLDTAFRLLRAAALPSMVLVLLVLGPVQVLASIGFESPFTAFTGQVPETVEARTVVLTLVGAVLSLFVSPLAFAGVTWIGAHTDESRAPDWREGLRAGARRYWPTLGAWALLVLAAIVLFAVGAVPVFLVGQVGAVVAVLLGLPLLLLFVVALLGLVMLGYLALPCVVIEERGAVDALRRAWWLLRQRFWPTVGTALLVGLVVELLGGAVSFLVTLPGLLPFPGAWVFIALGSILDQLLSVPLAAFAALAIHVDQRIRTEGYDVAVLVADLRR